MTETSLDTTNLFLGIIALVSTLQFLVVAVVGIVLYRQVRQAMKSVQEIETRHVAPLAAKVNGATDEFRSLIARVDARVTTVERSIDWVMKSADRTAGVVRYEVWKKAWPLIGLVRGVRAAMSAMNVKSPRNTSSH